MKRVLSLVLALVLVLGMIPTFAAEKTGGEELFELGLVKGDENGDLMVDQTLERQEFAIMIARLNGVEEEASAYVTPATYADFSKVADWARNYVSYAEEQEWMTGKLNNMFDPEAELKSQELLMVLMRVLGYTPVWETVFTQAEEIGLVAEEIIAIERGDAFELIWTAVNTKMADSDMTLGEHLGVLEPAKPVVTDLVVEDVVADNLKTMVVTFNQPVDEDTVTATTVKLVKGTTNVVASRLLSEDGLTLVIVYTTGAVAQSSELKLTIDGVKNVDGEKVLEDYEKTMVVTDVTIPAVKGVSAINAKQIEVFFSEPINFSAVSYQVINDLKVNDVAAIAKATPNYLNNSIVFELSTILKPGTHKVEVKNMLDFAGYKALTFTADVTVVEDKTAPVITSAVVKNINTIEVTFNEPLSVSGSFWVDSVSAAATVVAGSNNTKYTLTGFGALDLSAIVQIKVEYMNQEDVVANKVATKTSFIFKTEDDTTLPTVTAAVGTANKVTLTFSKSMNTAAGTIKVIDKDKVTVATITVASTLTWSENNTVLTFTGANLALDNVNPAEYTLNIKGMEDATVRKNLLAEANIVIAAVDTLEPTVTSTYFAKEEGTTGTNPQNDDTITFYFSEAMDVDTLKNLSNYVKNGTTPVALSAMTGVSVKSVAADAKSVTIVYPSAYTLSDTFTVYALKDAAGNMVTTNNSVTKLSSTTIGVVTNTVVSSSADKVVVEFVNKMSSVDPSFIKVQENGVDYAVPVSVSLNTAGTKATFTLNKAMATTTGAYTVVANNITLAENVYGSSYAANASFGALSIIDNVRPTAVVAASATAGHIKITFSEQSTVSGADATAKLANLLADMLLRDEDGLLLTPSITFYLNGSVSNINAFDMIALTGLTSTDSYSVELISRYVVDTATAANKVIGFNATTIVVK